MGLGRATRGLKRKRGPWTWSHADAGLGERPRQRASELIRAMQPRLLPCLHSTSSSCGLQALQSCSGARAEAAQALLECTHLQVGDGVALVGRTHRHLGEHPFRAASAAVMPPMMREWAFGQAALRAWLEDQLIFETNGGFLEMMCASFTSSRV